MRHVLWVLLVFTVAGCGREGILTYPDPGVERRFEASSTVLESPSHGPQLCASLLDSRPPACRGVDLIGWSWRAVEGEESVLGTTWGTYHVIGTWDREASTLTLTEAPRAPDQADDPERGKSSTPCPEPPGGWRVLDPERTNHITYDQARGIARDDPGFAGRWGDQSINPIFEGGDEPTVPEIMRNANDPRFTIFNASTTGDTEVLEAEIRRVWGGALCVSKARFTYAELESIQNDISSHVLDVGGLHVSAIGISESENHVSVYVFVVDAVVRSIYVDPFPEGAVHLTGFLEPVDPQL